MRTMLALLLVFPALASAEPVPEPEPEPAPAAPDPAPATPAPAPAPAAAKELTFDDEAAEGSALGRSPTIDVSGTLAREQTGDYSGSPRAVVSDWMLLQKGVGEVGGDLTFITSDATSQDVNFTDIGILTLRGRYSFGRVELGAAVDLLIKQPSYLDEPVSQGGGLVARVGVRHHMAAALVLTGGPLTGDKGLWGGVDLVLQMKKVVHETLVFQGSFGGAYTHLALDGTKDAWFVEGLIGGDTMLKTPRGEFGVFVGANLRQPIVASPDKNDGEAFYLDPQTRLNFSTGMVYAVVKNWDLMVAYSVVDRGDEGEPATTLPILSGGFDQRDFVFTIVHRWDPPRRARRYDYVAE